jgi:hypothetical protein
VQVWAQSLRVGARRSEHEVNIDGLICKQCACELGETRGLGQLANLIPKNSKSRCSTPANLPRLES